MDTPLPPPTMGTGGSSITFASLISVLISTTQLQVWNDSSGDDRIYFSNTTNLCSSLSQTSFHGGAGSGFRGNAFLRGNELGVASLIPKPESWLTASIILAGGVWQFRRRFSRRCSPCGKSI